MKYLSSIVNSSLGNILEWYDFGLFAIFSPFFSHLFFPNEDARTATIATASIFAIGFLCRPLGALFFGYLGDQFGRAKTLRLSILMISIPTLLIGCLPTYPQLGILAPIFLMIIRIWQGLSIGGEYSGNLVYLAETAPNKYRATFTSLASMSANIGLLLAALIGLFTSHVFSNNVLHHWGWRLPYLLSGFFCLFIYYFRLRMKESPVFAYQQQHQFITHNPIKTVFKNNFPHLLRTLGLVCMGTTFYYFSFIYIPIFLTNNLQHATQQVSILMTSLFILMIMLVPLSGLMCDYFGRRKMLLFNATLITLSVIPGFYFLQANNLMSVLSVLGIFTVASSLEQGTTSVSLVENFPLPARYTGISLGYNIGNGLLGGTVPIICEWLTLNTHTYLAPAFYISFCALITAMVVFFYVPETRHENLNKA